MSKQKEASTMPHERRRIRDGCENKEPDGYQDQPWLECCFNCTGSMGQGKVCFARRYPETRQARMVWAASVCPKFLNVRKEFRTKGGKDAR